MVVELWHRSEFLPARRAAGYNDAVATLGGDTRRLLNECAEVVSVEFGAECPVQLGFEHGSLLDWRGSGRTG